MKIKIFLALLCSAVCAVHAAVHLPRAGTQTPALTARQLKAKQAFDALPVDDSFNDLFGAPKLPVPPARHESLFSRSGSVKKIPVPVYGTQETAAPPIPMQTWLSGDDHGTAAPPMSMDDFKRGSRLAPSSPVPVAVPAGTSSRLATKFKAAVKAAVLDKTRGFPSSAISETIKEVGGYIPGGTLISGVSEIALQEANKQLPSSVSGRAVVSSRESTIKHTKWNRAKEVLGRFALKVVRKEGVEKPLNGLIETNLLDPFNEFIGKEFGATVGDLDPRKRLAKKLEQEATAAAVSKLTKGVINRETAAHAIGMVTDGVREAKSAVVKLGYETGVTPKLTALRRKIVSTGGRAFEAVGKVLTKPAPEE